MGLLLLQLLWAVPGKVGTGEADLQRSLHGLKDPEFLSSVVVLLILFPELSPSTSTVSPQCPPWQGRDRNPSPSSISFLPWEIMKSFFTPKSQLMAPLLGLCFCSPSGGPKTWERGPGGVGPGGGSCPAPLQPFNPPPGSQPSTKRRGHLAASTRQVCNSNLGNRNSQSRTNGIQTQPNIQASPVPFPEMSVTVKTVTQPPLPSRTTLAIPPHPYPLTPSFHSMSPHQWWMVPGPTGW
jgi:hypothetical protein